MALVCGGFWEEKTYFVNESDGIETLSGPLDELYARREGAAPEDDCMLVSFYVGDDGSIRQYYPSLTGDGRYRIREAVLTLKPAAGGNVMVVSDDETILQKSWIAGEELTIRKAGVNRIVFDSPVKEYTRRVWSGFVSEHTVALRSVWTRIYQPVNPLYNFEQVLLKHKYWREVKTGFLKRNRGFACKEPHDLFDLYAGKHEGRVPDGPYRLGTVSFLERGRMGCYGLLPPGGWCVRFYILMYTADVRYQKILLSTPIATVRQLSWFTGRYLTLYEILPGDVLCFSGPLSPSVQSTWQEFIDGDTAGIYSLWEPVTDPAEIAELDHAKTVIC